MVAHGHNGYLQEPQFEGREVFERKQLHSQEYRVPDEYVGKRVVVVGSGFSGGDIAAELGRVCSQVRYNALLFADIYCVMFMTRCGSYLSLLAYSCSLTFEFAVGACHFLHPVTRLHFRAFDRRGGKLELN